MHLLHPCSPAWHRVFACVLATEDQAEQRDSGARADGQHGLYWSAICCRRQFKAKEVEAKTLSLMSPHTHTFLIFVFNFFFVLNLSLRCAILRSEEVKTLLQTESLNATL